MLENHCTLYIIGETKATGRFINSRHSVEWSVNSNTHHPACPSQADWAERECATGSLFHFWPAHDRSLSWWTAFFITIRACSLHALRWIPTLFDWFHSSRLSHPPGIIKKNIITSLFVSSSTDIQEEERVKIVAAAPYIYEMTNHVFHLSLCLRVCPQLFPPLCASV